MALVEGTNCGFVTVAPTDDPAESIYTVDGNILAARFTAPSDATAITKIGWWYDPTSDAENVNFEVGIYSHDANNNLPNLLLGANQTNSTGTTDGIWLTSSVNVAVTGNTVYWLAIQVDTASGSLYTNRASNASYAFERKSASTLPSSYGATGTSGTYIISIYAVYTTGGAEAEYLIMVM